eukprot:7387089-Karenia_brevis.AAC.1
MESLCHMYWGSHSMNAPRKKRHTARPKPTPSDVESVCSSADEAGPGGDSGAEEVEDALEADHEA